jgi:hypothetical protein
MSNCINGINAKASRGDITVGIQLEQFIEAIKKLPVKNGWVNLIISPRKDPHPKGYTHIVKPQKQREKDGSTEGK